MHVVTIAARNYLSRARALGRSFRLHHPEDRFSVLLIDALPQEIPSTAGCRVITPAELPLDEAEFSRMAMLYDVTELSTSLKPWVLELLVDEGEQTVVYLDPDILVYDRLDDVARLADEHGIVLTPHRDTPMPRDGMRPNEAEIMCSGVFNLGFIAISPAARPMLTWWQERLSRDCVSRPAEMLFVDQRWIDLVPGLWDHAVLRDPGYNVAYWNLDDRELRVDGDRVSVNGRPLRFFHFSGYDPKRPWVLSKYVSDRPRVSLDEYPVTRQLCDAYGETISEGDDHCLDTPYRWGSLNDGTTITVHMRGMYRRALLAAEKGEGDTPPQPFRDLDEAIIQWFREPVRRGGQVNRFLYDVWRRRGDLRVAFPDPLGADEEQLVRWTWQNIDDDPSLVVWLLPDVAEPTSANTVSTAEPGVNLAGYLAAEMGVGELSRLTARALQHIGLPYATFSNSETLSRQKARYDQIDDGIRYPVTVAAVNADQFPLWAAAEGHELRRDKHTVGLWAWETEDFPAYTGSFALVDEIWAISRFVAAGVRAQTAKPVHVVPLPVLDPRSHRPLDRAALELPDGPYLLFVFDYLSVLERKNPMGLVAAFRRAFPRGNGPTLVIKTINARRYKSERTRLMMAIDRHDVGTHDVRVIDEYLDHDVVGSLMGEATAYVSLHRSEGFGLTMAESMARGVPVIGTAYSGNLDFMSNDNSLLVPYRRVRVGKEAHPYRPDSFWAEPDLDAAAEHMRWVVENPELAQELGGRGRDNIRRTHSLDVAGSFIRSRVDDILASRSFHTRLDGASVR